MWLFYIGMTLFGIGGFGLIPGAYLAFHYNDVYEEKHKPRDYVRMGGAVLFTLVGLALLIVS